MSLITIGTSTQSTFGEGARHTIPTLIGQDTAARVLIVASASSMRRPELAALRTSLDDVMPTFLWDQVSPNPRTGDIDACLATYADMGITHVLGIGGGSALDQAKATAMALHCKMDMTNLLVSKSPLPARDNTLILLPTTSGTGAELSFGAILTNTATSEKLGLRGAALAADHAIVDPELTWSVPVDVSMVTGFDVLTHALETWLSTAATPYTKDLSRGAICRVFEWLPVVHATPNHREARSEMAYASMVMGINLALSTTCLPHRLQYPIGAATDTAHAAGLAAIYSAWLENVLPHAASKLAECADWIGVAQGQDIPTRASAFVAAVATLQERIGLTSSLQDLGVTAEMIARFPSEVTGRLDTDPGYRGPEDLVRIYNRAFGL
jgi:alcohol dehydrogenase class IV